MVRKHGQHRTVGSRDWRLFGGHQDFEPNELGNREPAELFGIGATYGTLAAGKDADIVIWPGDPFELMEAPTHVLIRGREIDLVSRQTLLRDRYMELLGLAD
ncbi:MAG: amidohydrolase family protein [Sphingomonadales bacterium]|nr:amidohydrolase family protein [Sphingomonadales bacterium]